jgi:poly(glycerol-phosphate) alpha-glucosyltransferase
MLDPWAVRNSRWKKKIAGVWFEHANLNGAHCMHALCDSEMQSMRAYGLKNPISVLPNGVELPNLDESCADPAWLNEERKALLFLGRIHPKKGLPLLLDAWAKLKKQNSRYADEWFLAIGGWSEVGHIDKLRQQARDLGIEGDIRFLGSLYGDAKNAALRNASAFVLPSYSEGLPMSVLEAWAYKLPSLITPECNLPEGFEQEVALRIETNAESVAMGLQNLFEMSDQERVNLGQRAYDLVRSQFTWPKIAEQTQAVYNWMLGGGDAPETVRFR